MSKEITAQAWIVWYVLWTVCRWVGRRQRKLPPWVAPFLATGPPQFLAMVHGDSEDP